MRPPWKKIGESIIGRKNKKIQWPTSLESWHVVDKGDRCNWNLVREKKGRKLYWGC